MANKVANTRKVFNFSIDINGVNQFEVQSVTLPDVEIETAEHGDMNYTVKTGGRLKVGTLKLEKLRPLPTSDTAMWDWLFEVQDPTQGGGMLPSDYKQLVTINELSTDNQTIVNTWTYDGVFPTKISQNKFDRMSSDNVIESVEFSVDVPVRS